MVFHDGHLPDFRGGPWLRSCAGSTTPRRATLRRMRWRNIWQRDPGTQMDPALMMPGIWAKPQWKCHVVPCRAWNIVCICITVHFITCSYGTFNPQFPTISEKKKAQAAYCTYEPMHGRGCPSKSSTYANVNARLCKYKCGCICNITERYICMYAIPVRIGWLLHGILKVYSIFSQFQALHNCEA